MRHARLRLWAGWVRGDRQGRGSGRPPLKVQAHVPLYSPYAATAATTARTQAVQRGELFCSPSTHCTDPTCVSSPPPSQGGRLGHSPALAEPALGPVRKQTRNDQRTGRASCGRHGTLWIMPAGSRRSRHLNEDMRTRWEFPGSARRWGKASVAGRQAQQGQLV